MKIATWNVNSIKSRLDHVRKWCAAVRPDVLCLQETKIVDKNFPLRSFHTIGYDHIEINGERAYNGVAIISNYELTGVQKNFPGDGANAPRRLIAANVNDMRIVNVYAPHGTKLGSDKFAFKLDWIAKLRTFFDQNFGHDDKLLLCGDLNVAPHVLDVWNPSYWQDRMHFTKLEREAILALKKWGFVDLFRQVNDESREYSWWDHTEWSFRKDQGLRIDHIWASPALAELCRDCWIDKTPRAWEHPSDHAPVVAVFDL